MVWNSVDELLEKVLLKLYKRWDAGALARLRPWLDEERLRLGTALRSLASAHVTQSEDAILLFLDRLAGQEPIMTLAREELESLGEVKQALMRARRPSMRLRGFRPKPTNLSPVRLQVLLTLLEAVEPPAYAVTRMYLPGGGEELTELLEYVVVQVYGNWARLTLETRDAVLRTLNTVRAGIVDEGDHFSVNVRNVVETLHLFEAMPETLHYACHAFLAGKVDVPPETPPQLYTQAPISAQLADLLTHPMPLAGGVPSGEAAPPKRAPQPERAAPPVEPPPFMPVLEPAPLPSAEQPATPAPQPLPAPPVAAVEVEPPPPAAQAVEPPAAPEPIQPAPPRVAREPAKLGAVVERVFHTDVRFPQQVRVGDEVPLIVRLTRPPFAAAQRGGAPGPDQLDRPDYVEVVVVATGFNEGTASWSRTVAVYGDREPQPAIFLLRAGREVGDQRVTVNFYHQARYLGSVAFTSKVVAQAPAAVAGVTAGNSRLAARFVGQPPPPADLELRIVRGGSDNLLSFMLHSTKAGVGYHWRPMGQVRLNAANPRAYLETIFAHLSRQEAKPVEQLLEGDASVDPEALAVIGRQLFHELFPAELQHEFWTRIRPRRRDSAHPDGAIETLSIVSDEPWIPWEMVKPFLLDPESGAEQSDGFLCETFQVARWLAGRGPVEALQVQAAAVVAPGDDAVYSRREEAFFQALSARQVQVDDPLRSHAALRQLAQTDGVQLLHIAAHGRAASGRQDTSDAGQSPWALEDGSLTPAALAGEQGAGLWKARPLVFLNICHTARLGFALTGLGEWVAPLIGDAGVGALVGTLWEVNDLLAAEFAVTFYERLLAGDTLGRAFHTARLHVRDRQPANATWLAYVLYADPNATVVWGSGEVQTPEEPEPALLPAPMPEPEPEPALDLDDLRAMLEGALAGSLTELVQRAIPGAVATALELWTAPEGNATESQEAGGEEPDGEELGGEAPDSELPSAQEPAAVQPAPVQPDAQAPVGEPVEEAAAEAPAPGEFAAEQPSSEPLQVEGAAQEPAGSDTAETTAQSAAGEAESGDSTPAAAPPSANSDLYSWMPADWLSAREAELREELTEELTEEWPAASDPGTPAMDMPESGAAEDAPGKGG